MQQMSMSFGVAAASLVTAIFIPDRFHFDGAQMIGGIHKAFLVLGALTIGSALVFRELEEGDRNSVSQQATRSCDGVNVRYLPSMRKVVLATADKAEVQLGCLSRWGQSPANCSATFWSREIIIQKICGVY